MVNWPGRKHYGTPLQEAIERGGEDVVKLLLEHGADVNLVGGYHGSALAYAILDERKKGTCDKYMQLLLDAGADVNLQGGDRWGCPLGVSSLPSALT